MPALARLPAAASLSTVSTTGVLERPYGWARRELLSLLQGLLPRCSNAALVLQPLGPERVFLFREGDGSQREGERRNRKNERE